MKEAFLNTLYLVGTLYFTMVGVFIICVIAFLVMCWIIPTLKCIKSRVLHALREACNKRDNGTFG